jgi:pyruvate carboxylase
MSQQGQGHSETGANIYVLGKPSGVDPHQYRRPSLGGFYNANLFYASDIGIPQAVHGVSASQGELVDLFERIENVFRRLEIYVELPQTMEMSDIIVKAMVEVLLALALVIRYIKQGKLSEL